MDSVKIVSASEKLIRCRLPERDTDARPHQGYSLVECLVVNALALSRVAGLFAATADLIAAARATSVLSDRAMRARQVIQFIEQAVASARMPAEWLMNDEISLSSQGWHRPSPLCASPETISGSPQWGGIDVIDTASLPCFALTDPIRGLYIEQIQPCPHNCGARAGYVISPTTCSGKSPTINRLTQWQVKWGPDMSQPAHCDAGWPWGRLQRLLLTDRSGENSIEGLPTLRLQSLSRASTYQWQQAETLVAGIADWQPTLITVASAQHYASEGHEAAHYLLAVDLSVTSDHVADKTQDLRVTRLLFPSAVDSNG